MLIFAFGISWFVISLFFKRMANVSSEYVSISAGYTGKNTSFTALRDTGHSLTDPITGYSVIIAGIETLCPLFDKTVITALEKPAAIALSELGDRGYAFRLIPYSAVGVENGMLLAFRPDFVRVNGKESSEYLIAVSPNQVSDGGAYSALIGVDNY